MPSAATPAPLPRDGATLAAHAGVYANPGETIYTLRVRDDGLEMVYRQDDPFFATVVPAHTARAHAAARVRVAHRGVRDGPAGGRAREPSSPGPTVGRWGCSGAHGSTAARGSTARMASQRPGPSAWLSER